MQDDKSVSQELFELLHQGRNGIAKVEKVKPYMVLHNSVLEAIAEKRPSTLEELSEIKGMGEKKIARYGKFILENVNGFNAGSTQETGEGKVYSVSEFIDFLNELLVPQRAIVQGEVSQIKMMNGYTFFILVDKAEEATLSCFVWKDRLDSFGVKLEEGMELKVAGFPKIFKRRGSFNFEVEHIGLVGEGALKQAFEALKKRLSVAGYFAQERKKPIPKYVQQIGLITSSFGDARNDFLTHLGKFGFKIYFHHVRVEGLYAIDDITSAIRRFNESMTDVEVLALTRGGGSLESLQPFNSETIAKAIFGSKIPIITAIGHENDETIADLVADMYASTPTHAARILSDPWRQAEGLLSSYEGNIFTALRGKYVNIKEKLWVFESSFVSALNKGINFRKEKIDSLQRALILSFHRIIDKIKSVEREFLNNWERLRTQILTLGQLVKNQESILFQETMRWIPALQKRLDNVEQRLALSDPTGRLKQGYSIAFNVGNRVIKSSKQIKVGEELSLKFYKGGATTRVEEKKV